MSPTTSPWTWTRTPDRAAINRVLGVHARACPVYRSLHPQIHITTSLELTRTPPG